MPEKINNICFLKHSEIDKPRWDKSVKESINRSIYAYSWYLDIVSPNWAALATPDYSELWPLPQDSKWGISYVYQPFFTQQLGLISKIEIDRSRIECFWKKICKKYNYAHLHLNVHNPKSGYDFETKRLTHWLGLQKPYEELYKAYNENLKRNIKKANKNSVEVVSEGKINHMIGWLKKDYHKLFKGIKLYHYDMLNQLLTELDKRKCQHIYTAQINKEPVAMALFVKLDDQIIYLIGVNNEKGKKSGAMHLIFDQMIRQYAGAEVYLDFEGSMVPSIAQFFKSFGAEEKEFYQWHYNALPWPLNKIKK
jgi:hypothetical protein